MENADKKIRLLLICFHLKTDDILLSFFLLASLYQSSNYETTVKRPQEATFDCYAQNFVGENFVKIY